MAKREYRAMGELVKESNRLTNAERIRRLCDDDLNRLLVCIHSDGYLSAYEPNRPANEDFWDWLHVVSDEDIVWQIASRHCLEEE